MAMLAATSADSSGTTRTSNSKRILRGFVVVVLCVYAAYLLRTITSEPHNGRQFLLIGAMLSALSIVLAWLARLAWTKVTVAIVRYALVIVLAYHALFGPMLMLRRVMTDVSSNGDLAIVLWPHVVHFINSFE